MNPALRRLARQAGLTLIASLLLLGGTVLSTVSWLGATPAGAATAPPWEPDPDAVGGLIFYNAAGTVITGGNVTDSPMAAYVEGTSTPRFGDSVASLYGYLPVQGQQTSEWSGEQLGLTTPFPNSSAPAPLNTSTLPVETGNAGDKDLFQLESDFPQNGTGAYADMYQLRLYTNAPHHTQGTSYDAADILLSGTGSTATWSLVYPTTPSFTSLSVAPASPQEFGTQETLTATVTPSSATGTVQFLEGSTDIGSPVTVSGGTAHVQTSTLPGGADVLIAAFTPTAGTDVSQSNAVQSFTVTPVSTSTSLSVSPPSPQLQGTQETLTATVTPSSAAGTVQFMNGSNDIGTPVTVSGGTAVTQTTLPVGSNTLSAVFTPANIEDYSTSTSNTVPYTVNPIVSTTTTLTASPPSPVQSGTPVTLTATISPSAATGNVQFEANDNDLGGPVTVSGGKADLDTSTLPVGDDSLTAVFTATADSGYTSSTSSAVSYTVTGITTTTTLTASPPSPVQSGTQVTLTATISPSAATGTVQFEANANDLGSAVDVSGGTAVLQTTALPVGDDSLTAVFTPLAGNNYDGSASIPVSYTVTGISTTTTLTASPPSPVTYGTSVTLTATVAPSAATGAVQFEANDSDLGGPVTVSGGKADLDTSTLPVGDDSLTAVFTPTAGNGYAASTSTPVLYTVNAIQTSTTIAVSPPSPVQFGTAVTLTATVSPSAAPGVVQFEVDGSDFGSAVTVSGGTAVLLTSTLPVGDDSLTAVFTPTAGNGYAGSTSTPVSYTVNAIQTATTLAVSPTSPVYAGTPVTLTATISPTAAAGTVQFEVDGSDFGSPVTVSDSTGVLHTTTLPVGTNSLSAVFTPSSDDYAGSTSNSVSYTVNPVTSTATTLTASPASPQQYGTPETLAATVSPSAAPGTVQFEVDGTDIGSPVTVSGGIAHTQTSTLPVGTNTLSAVFTATSGSGFGGSTGTASFTVAGHAANGYWLVGSDGSVHNYGAGSNYGSAASLQLNAPIVGAASTPDGKGYWLVGADGGVFTFGDALFYGSAGGMHLNAPVVGIAATPDGKGYWLVAADGGVFTYGDALFYGSAGSLHLNKPVVGIAATPDGKGYWLAAADGGVFTYGDAVFHGSAGSTPLNEPVVGIAATPDGKGYWLAAADGGVFTYGDALFYGSAGGTHLDAPVVGIGSTSDGKGYWLFAADGGVFTYGDALFFGSAGGTHLSAPIVGQGIE